MLAPTCRGAFAPDMQLRGHPMPERRATIDKQIREFGRRKRWRCTRQAPPLSGEECRIHYSQLMFIALSLKFRQKACGKHNWRCMTHAKMVQCFLKSILVGASTTTRRI